MTRDLRLVSGSLFAWGVGEALFFYFIPLYLAELGADPLQIGGILGLVGAVMLVTHIPAGALADRLGSRRLMIAGWATGLTAAVMMFLAPSLPLFVAGLMLYNFTGFVMAPLNSYITSARGRWSVARALTTTSALFNLGGVVGAPLGGLLGGRLGLRQVYGVTALIFLLSTLMITRVQHYSGNGVPARGSARALLRTPRFLGFVGVIFFTLFALYVNWPLTPNYLEQVHDVPLGMIGVFGSLNSLGMVVLNLTLGRLAPRLGFVLAQVLVAGSALFLWRGTGALWFGMGYFLAGGYRAARNIAVSMVEGMVEPSRLGLAYGVLETASSLVMVLAPPVAGLLFRVDPPLPYPVSLLLIGLALLFTLRLQVGRAATGQRAGASPPSQPDPEVLS